MAECQNFFDDTRPQACRSSSSTDQSPRATRNESAEHGLELRLGPSVDTNKPKQHDMVRPIPLYPSLDKQRSGNFAHAVENSPLFLGHNDVAMADKALSKDSAFSTPPRISREQVWQTLEKTNAVLGQQDACASRAFCDDAALSVWSRRSASMQIMIPSSELSEGDVCPIRRSCSNGFIISRQSSLSQEALVDESPSPTNLRPFDQQEALELQKRREMQAQRRLEARKRRRLLMETKHQKKARQNSGVINMHCLQQTEKDSPAHIRAKDRSCAVQTHPKTQHANLCVKRGNKQDLKGEYARGDVHTEEHPLARGGGLNKPSDKSDKNDLGKHIEGDLTGMQSVVESGDLSGPAMHESSQAGKSAVAMEGIKPTPSSCSETESTETKGRNCSKDMDLSERESSSQKSSTENCPEQSGLAKAPHSKPMLYPRALSRTRSGIPTVPANFVSPRSTQHLPADSGKNDGFHTSHLTSSGCKSSAASGDMVSNSFAIKKSVGVFCEGKWKTLDEKSAFLPIRRTTSNVIEAATDPQRSAKHLEGRVSAATPQQKFARMGLDTTADASYKNKVDAPRENFSCASRLYLLNMKVKEELDSEEEKPVIGSKGAAPMGDMPSEMITSGMLKAKVKQEEDTTGFDHQLLNPHQQPDAGSAAQSGTINRQRSTSFLDLPRVTTTGRGPNGRTINGVMYITGGHSVWLVCRCHGKHMSPAEFVEHSGSTDLSNPLKNIVVNPPLLFNQIASTPG